MKYFSSLLWSYLQKYGKNIEFVEQQCNFAPSTLNILLTGLRFPRWNEIYALAQIFQINPLKLIMPEEVIKKWQSNLHTWVILDVDGVLTDNGIYISSRKVETKRFNAKDGYAIKQMMRSHYQVAFLSNAKTKSIIAYRAGMLDVKLFYVGEEPKIEIFRRWTKKYSIIPDQVIYVGDDGNDLEMMEAVGFSVCPSDAYPLVLQKADLALFSKGGEGCISELWEYMKLFKTF